MPAGGKRTGSGRPATRGERKQPLTIRITPTLRAYLDQCDDSIAETIEDAVRRTAAFRTWQRNRTS
jgi:hypothetical protein